MRGITLRAVILFFWAVAMVWLIRFEAFPEAFTHTLPGYKGLLSENLILSDSWMKVLISGRPAGYVHTTMDTDDKDALHHYHVGNQMLLAVNLMGQRHDIRLDGMVQLDITRNLQSFNVSLTTGLMDDIAIRGHRDHDSIFSIIMRRGTNVTSMSVNIPDDIVLYSPMSTQLAKNLKPGEKLTIKTMDPFSLTPTAITMNAIRRETITLGAEHVPALLLRTEQQGLTLDSWIGENGEMLRQNLPAGIALEKASPTEGTAAYVHADLSTDILTDIFRIMGTQP